MTDYQVAIALLEELESQSTNVRAGRGYGVGHPHWERESERQLLGTMPFEEERVEEPEDKHTKKVQISRVFKK